MTDGFYHLIRDAIDDLPYVHVTGREVVRSTLDPFNKHTHNWFQIFLKLEVEKIRPSIRHPFGMKIPRASLESIAESLAKTPQIGKPLVKGNTFLLYGKKYDTKASPHVDTVFVQTHNLYTEGVFLNAEACHMILEGRTESEVFEQALKCNY